MPSDIDPPMADQISKSSASPLDPNSNLGDNGANSSKLAEIDSQKNIDSSKNMIDESFRSEGELDTNLANDNERVEELEDQPSTPKSNGERSLQSPPVNAQTSTKPISDGVAASDSDQDFANRIQNDNRLDLEETQKRLEKKYHWLTLTSSYINRVRALYVPPNASFEQTESVSRIIFLSGPKNSGRFFSAAGFARKLRQQREGNDANLLRLQPERDCISGLLSIIGEDRDLPSNSILLIEDIQAISGSTDELSEENLSYIEEVLETKNCHLLIILEADSERFSLPKSSRCTHLSMGLESTDQDRRIFLSTVLENHLEFDEDFGNGVEQLTADERTEIRQELSVFAAEFRVAPQINTFCNAIALRDARSVNLTENLRQRLIQIAKQVGATNNSHAQKWFQQLEINEKLFALLTLLLRGMPCNQIRNVYHRLTAQLRKDRFLIDDPRAQGYFDILRRLQIEEESNGTEYRFLNSAFQSELEYQLQNYRDLLSGTAMVVWEMASQFDVPTRRLVGPVISRLRRHDWPGLETQIRSFQGLIKEADDRNLAFIPADALAESYTLHRSKVLSVLESWLASDDIRNIWTVIISVGECVAAIRRNEFHRPEALEEDCRALQSILKRAILWRFPVSFFGQPNEKSQASFGLIYALRYTLSLFREFLPTQYVAIIKEWGGEIPPVEGVIAPASSSGTQTVPEESDQPPSEVQIADNIKRRWLRIVIRMFARSTLAEFKDADVFQQPSLEWVRDLACTLVVTEPEVLGDDWAADGERDTSENNPLAANDTGEDEYRIAIECIVHWMGRCVTPKTQQECENWLSSVIQQCNHQQRRKFAKHLKQHQVDISNETRDFCDSVLMRMLVLEGTPVDPSSSTYGIVLIHGQTAELNRLKTYARRVQQQIAHFTPLKTGVLGDLRLVDNSPSASSQRDAYEGIQSRPPLVMPLLEQVQWDIVPFVLLICSESKRTSSNGIPIVIDLADLRSAAPHAIERVLVIKDQRPGQKPTDANVVAGFAHHMLPFDPIKGPKHIEYLLSRKVRGFLASRTVTEWKRVLQIDPAEDLTNTTRSIVGQLEHEAEQLKITSGFTSAASHYRRFSGLLQLLRICDLSEYCSLIRTWLDSNTAIQIDLAKGALLLALRVLRFQPPGTPSATLPLLTLWNTLVSKASLRLEALALLEFVCWRFGIPDCEFADDPVSVETEVHNFCLNVPISWRNDFLEHLVPIIKNDQAVLNRAVKEKDEIRVAALERKIGQVAGLQSDLLVGPRNDFQPLDNYEYIVIIVDVAERNGPHRAKIAAKYHDLLRKHFSGKKVQPILFRLGISDPVAVNERCPSDYLVPQGLKPRSSLVMPILEQFSPEQLRTVVIFSPITPYDWDDASDSVSTLTAFIPESPRQKFPANSWIVPLKDGEALDKIRTDRTQIEIIAKDLVAKTILLN
jgi:hypothetical protein